MAAPLITPLIVASPMPPKRDSTHGPVHCGSTNRPLIVAPLIMSSRWPTCLKCLEVATVMSMFMILLKGSWHLSTNEEASYEQGHNQSQATLSGVNGSFNRLTLVALPRRSLLWSHWLHKPSGWLRGGHTPVVPPRWPCFHGGNKRKLSMWFCLLSCLTNPAGTWVFWWLSDRYQYVVRWF